MNPLASAILRGEIRDGQHVRVDFEDGGFAFHGAAAIVPGA